MQTHNFKSVFIILKGSLQDVHEVSEPLQPKQGALQGEHISTPVS